MGLSLVVSVIGLCVAIVSGCATTMKVDAESDPMVNLRAYRTYSWVSNDQNIRAVPRSPKDVDLLDWRIRIFPNALSCLDHVCEFRVNTSCFVLFYWLLSLSTPSTSEARSSTRLP